MVSEPIRRIKDEKDRSVASYLLLISSLAQESPERQAKSLTGATSGKVISYSK